jgi:two-component system sensor histidine kinase and response regulator WspE
MSEDLSGLSMLELFRLEVEGQNAVLSAGVLSIEDLRQSPETIEGMMRAAHSLKGAARIVGLDPAVRVAHALEDVFVAAGQGRLSISAEHADTLLAGIDFFSSIGFAEDANESSWQTRADGLVADLERISGGSSSGQQQMTPPAPAPAEIVPAHRSPRPPAAKETHSAQAAPPPPAVTPEPPPPVATTPRSAGNHPPPAGRPAGEDEDRVVRVSAASLSRLVGLAGEALVETRQLRPFVDSLQVVRGLQTDLGDAVTALEDELRSADVVLPSPQLAKLEGLRQRAADARDRLTELVEGFESYARRNEDLSDRLHHEVISSRMRPLADGIRGFPRLVRDVARQLGKQARLEIRGDTTGVDRDILDKLEAPLSHLLRNAIDHGLETPEERQQADKPPVGTILLEAGHRAGTLVITIADDGRGIDVEMLRSKVIERGLVVEPVAARLSTAELLEFLFLPGFSTKTAVSEISGRGVGLDVVQTMVKAVGGSVRVTTQPGRQTLFTLQLPITMSVIRALLVAIDGEPYAFPLTRIDRIVSAPRSTLRSVEGRLYLDHDGMAIGLVRAADILELEQAGETTDPLAVVVVSDRGQCFGLIVDRFLGERDLEVRPLDPRLGKVPDISSASLLEQGEPVLFIDVEDLVRSIDNLLGGRGLRRVDRQPAAQGPLRTRRILVVDDSITVRELERQLLQSRGYEVDVAVDGMDGWNAFRDGSYDLVITDVDMPRMDGIGLVTLIKTDGLRGGVPVVIVSYKDREEDRLRGLDAGATRYLTKSSFHDETFIRTIEELIGEPRG